MLPWLRLEMVRQRSAFGTLKIEVTDINTEARDKMITEGILPLISLHVRAQFGGRPALWISLDICYHTRGAVRLVLMPL